MSFENIFAFLIISTLSLMVALSWNDLARGIVNEYSDGKGILIYLIYALVVTAIAVALLWGIKSNANMPSGPDDVEFESLSKKF